MKAFVSRYLPSAFLAIAPLFTNDYSVLDFVGFSPDASGAVALGLLHGPKDEVEMTLRLVVTLTGIALMLFFGWSDAPPARTLATFRREYLNRTIKEWKRKSKLHSHVRVNVMFVRWTWWGRVLRIEWKESFKASDRDGNISFWSWQGACGAAFRKKEAVFARIGSTDAQPRTSAARWLCFNRFKLTPFQLWKTRSLKAVLCVPIIDKTGEVGAERYRCVGVLNLDATTDVGADYLESKKERLATALAEHGTLIAKLH